MILFFTVLCVSGGFILRWRRASLAGYFDSRAAAPGIVRYALGNLFVLALGLIAYWGSGLLIFMLSDWQWAVLALLLGLVLRGPLLRWACGPPRGSQAGRTQVPQFELHYKVRYMKHIRWNGRIPIPDSSCDFVAPGGTVTQDWVSLAFPEPFGEYGREERFYATLKSEDFERACKNSPAVLGYWRVEPDAWRKAAAED
jgi:hypothetical protein